MDSTYYYSYVFEIYPLEQLAIKSFLSRMCEKSAF